MILSRRSLFIASAALIPPLNAAAQTTSKLPVNSAAGTFIEVVLIEGRTPVWISAAEVVRVARVENQTVLDTTAWVQQRTNEPVEAVARRLAAAGQRMVSLTDLSNARIYLAADRVVLVREAKERYAAGARAAVVMVGLRYNSEVAVRETAEEVMATVRRAVQVNPAEPPATGTGR